MSLHLTGRVVDLVGERFDVAPRMATRLADSTLGVPARGAAARA